jgi:TetR/AcrR family transcriptional repressor of nem operon
MGRCSDARDRLLATASRLVHERGYTAVSVNDICEEAGLKKGSFYHFFPSKHALVLATLERFSEYQELRVQAAIQSATSAREQLVGMLTGLYHGFLAARRAYGAAHGCALGNLAQEMAHRDPELRAALGTIFKQWQARLAMFLEHAHRRGDLEVRNASGAAEAIVAYLQGATLLAKATDDPDVFLRLAHGAVALAEASLPKAEVPAAEATPAGDAAYGEDQCCDPSSACQVRGALS